MQLGDGLWRTADNMEIIFPSIYRSSDLASRFAQICFVRLNIAQLLLIVLTGFISGITPIESGHIQCVATVVAILLLIVLAVNYALRIGKFDDRWFQCRALAENIKSASWFYMTGMLPNGLDIQASRIDLIDKIDEIKRQFPVDPKHLIKYNVGNEIITSSMNAIWNLPIDQKIDIYRRERLENQINWYTGKARSNLSWETPWFWSIFVIEFIGVAYSAFQIWSLFTLNIVGGLSALSAAGIAWIQLKRYSDLANSYAVAREDLIRISEARRGASTQDEFKLMVSEVEAAISREHSMWKSRIN